MKAGDIKSLETWAGDLDGVFAMSDLKVLFRGQSEAVLYKKLEVEASSRPRCSSRLNAGCMRYRPPPWR